MLTLQPFVVNLSARGAVDFSAVADKQFFENFGNSEILDADIKVDAKIRNRGTGVDVDAVISGKVTVPCDLCLEPVEIGIETGFQESYIPEGEELDLSQDVYDYVCTALPLHRVHPEGECDEDTIKFLSK